MGPALHTPAEADRVAYTETLSPPEVEQLWPLFPFDLRERIISEPPPSAAADRTPPATIGDDRVRRLVTAAADTTALPQLLGPSGTGIGSNSMVVAGLHALHERAVANGLAATLIGQEQTRECEPHVAH